MQRYKSREDVVLGDKILFDNSTGFLQELPYINMVGRVVERSLFNDNIKVEFYHGEKIVLSIPYYLAQ